MGAATTGVTFLNLAYLIEISVVLNLAYRELKFPEMHKLLDQRVREILKAAKTKEMGPGVGKYPEYDRLASLINKPEKNGNTIETTVAGVPIPDLWQYVHGRRWFFNNFIKKRWSLRIVNASVLTLLGILIFCTFAAGWWPPIEDVYAMDTLLKKLWVGLFAFLVFLTLLPVIFIRAATLCESHLFGDDAHPGMVETLRGEMFSRHEADLKELDKNARSTKLGKEKQQKKSGDTITGDEDAASA